MGCSRCFAKHITKKQTKKNSQATYKLTCQENLQRDVKEKHCRDQEIDGIPLVGRD